jgi:transcriptional regulator with XRE-family HTH domain
MLRSGAHNAHTTKDLLVVAQPSTLSAVAELTWHIGDVVYKLRSAKHWTQKQLAKRAGLHHNTIVRLENGDEGVQSRTLKQVADALGVSRQELWALVPESAAAARRKEDAS